MQPLCTLLLSFLLLACVTSAATNYPEPDIDSEAISDLEAFQILLDTNPPSLHAAIHDFHAKKITHTVVSDNVKIAEAVGTPVGLVKRQPDNSSTTTIPVEVVTSTQTVTQFSVSTVTPPPVTTTTVPPPSTTTPTVAPSTTPVPTIPKTTPVASPTFVPAVPPPGTGTGSPSKRPTSSLPPVVVLPPPLSVTPSGASSTSAVVPPTTASPSNRPPAPSSSSSFDSEHSTSSVFFITTTLPGGAAETLTTVIVVPFKASQTSVGAAGVSNTAATSAGLQSQNASPGSGPSSWGAVMVSFFGLAMVL